MKNLPTQTPTRLKKMKKRLHLTFFNPNPKFWVRRKTLPHQPYSPQKMKRGSHLTFFNLNPNFGWETKNLPYWLTHSPQNNEKRLAPTFFNPTLKFWETNENLPPGWSTPIPRLKNNEKRLAPFFNLNPKFWVRRKTYPTDSLLLPQK
jgi:hypothetical protein